MKWEYKYVAHEAMYEIMDRAEILGKDGWEMVNFTAERGSGFNANQFYAMFKRAKT